MTKTAKQIVLDLLEKLPDDVTLERLICELDFRAKLQRGLAQAERGEGIPHEEVVRRLNKWLESSGQQGFSEP